MGRRLIQVLLAHVDMNTVELPLVVRAKPRALMFGASIANSPVIRAATAELDPI